MSEETNNAEQSGKAVDAAGQAVPDQTGLDDNQDAQTGAVDVGGEVEHREGMFGVRGSGDTSGYGGLRRTVSMPGPSQPPYGDGHDAVVDRLYILAGGGIEKIVVHAGELTIFVRRDWLPDVARRMRDDAELRYELFSGVSGVHYPHETDRELHAVYHLVSLTHGRRVRLEVVCPDNDPHIPSVVPTYPAADWHERETYDFFGIIFDGHPALTRIEMPDDWIGHPQRKDYPLGGIDVEFKGAVIPSPERRRAYN